MSSEDNLLQQLQSHLQTWKQDGRSQALELVGQATDQQIQQLLIDIESEEKIVRDRLYHAVAKAGENFSADTLDWMADNALQELLDHLLDRTVLDQDNIEHLAQKGIEGIESGDRTRQKSGKTLLTKLHQTERKLPEAVQQRMVERIKTHQETHWVEALADNPKTAASILNRAVEAANGTTTEIPENVWRDLAIHPQASSELLTQSITNLTRNYQGDKRTLPQMVLGDLFAKGQIKEKRLRGKLGQVLKNYNFQLPPEAHQAFLKEASPLLLGYYIQATDGSRRKQAVSRLLAQQPRAGLALLEYIKGEEGLEWMNKETLEDVLQTEDSALRQRALRLIGHTRKPDSSDPVKRNR